MVALALEEQGIDVVSVGNGEAAVRRIPDLTPDLVLADVFMPVRNGYEVCEFVKKDERFSHVPVILLVGAFDPLDEKEARRVGADGVLKKPFVPPDPLIAMVTSALEKNPKLAAELAREREAAQARPEPELPSIALESPARTAPKPLPDFPEPSPEEAALIYGFKKPSDGPADESAPARFSSTKGQETQEEFDESATASDWRRNAANFEVPDEVGAKPAFSTDEDFGPVVFPSERDVPPRRVTNDDEDAKPHASRGFEPTMPMEPVEEETSREHAAPFAQTKSPAPIVPPAPARSEESAPRPEEAADSEYSEEGWMSSLLGKFRRSKSAKEESDSKQEAATPAEQPAAASRDSAPAADNSHSGPGEERVPAALESWFAPHPPVLGDRDSEPAHTPASAFPPETANNLMSTSADVEAPERQAHRAPPASGFPWSSGTSESSESAEHDSYPYSGQQAREESAREETSPARDQSESSLSTREIGTKDSALHSFLPPAPVEHSADQDSADDPAVHSTPSVPIFASPAPMPWAMDEASQLESDRGERIPTAPPPNREALAGIPFLTPPQPAPEAGAVGSAQTESLSDSSTQPAANGFGSHSVPSQAPAPSSEASPATREPVVVESAAAPSVDAVVARLLEKLEPQLHQLLDKDLLRPLVENLLREELEHKTK